MSVIEIVGGAILLVVSAVILLTLMQHTHGQVWPVPSTVVWAVPTMHA